MTAPAPPEVQLGRDTRAAQVKARVLREALPWITRWTGRTVVVKFGGNALPGGRDDEDAVTRFGEDVALLRRVGLRVVVVHGGGPQISALSERMGLRPSFVEGQRVTDEATLDVVKMVLLGQVNPALVAAVTAAGAGAVGVAGTDANLLRAQARSTRGWGVVGQVQRCNPFVLHTLLDEGVVPVVAPLARGADGKEYNVNADLAAGAVAAALQADKLIYLTNVPGLYEDFGVAGVEPTLLAATDVAAPARDARGRGQLSTGMVPKVTSVLVRPRRRRQPGAPPRRPPRARPAARDLHRRRRRHARAEGDTAHDHRRHDAPGAALQDREAAALLPTYGRQPVAFTAGQGAWLVDADGRRYLDCLSGLAVTSLGHAHPAVTEAVARQAATLVHTSNLFYTEPQVALAERLGDCSAGTDARTFLCNSGAEANEAAIKLARRHGKRQDPDKVRVVALRKARSTDASSGRCCSPATRPSTSRSSRWATGSPTSTPTTPRGSTPRSTDETCAVFVEVVQGEGGVQPVPEATLAAARRRVRPHRRAARVRRGADGARTPRKLVRVAGQTAVRARRRLPREGARERAADRRDRRARGGREGVRARRPRLHLRGRDRSSAPPRSPSST